MKKLSLTALLLIPFLAGLLTAQTNEADEAYIKAVTTPSPAQKAQLLKEFVTKYAGKGSQYENFAYANLCLLAYPGKTDKETIDYGEKALAVGGLDDVTKCSVMLVLSATYTKLGQNLDKAKGYGAQVVEIGRANKDKESATTTASQWNQIIGGGYFAQGQAQEKAKDIKGAVDSYVSSYGLLKNAQILASIKKIAKASYDSKSYADAEKAARAAYNVSKNYETAVFLAQILYKAGRNDEALTFFKEAYTKKKSGEMAYNIGIILAKTTQSNTAAAGEAIRYLLEASFTYPAASQVAMNMAQNLFFTSSKDAKFNDTIKEIQDHNKKIEELTKTFNTKFGDKNEEDLSDAEKTEMKNILASIDAEQKAIQKLQASNTEIVAKFNKLVEETKAKLGIK